MIHKLIFKIGQKIRNPSIDNWFLFLKKSESWSREQLESYQLEKLKELLIFSYKYSEFYKGKFDVSNFSVSEIKTLKDLNKIPVTLKQDLIKNNKKIQASYPFKKVMRATTSGSTGESLVFDREEEADSFNRASIFRGYSWHGVKPWDKNGYFWGFNFSKTEIIKTKVLDFLQNRFRVFSYDQKYFESFVKKLHKSKYVHGYSSMIFQTAKLINERNLKKPLGLKMIKGTSEKIFENYQEEVNKAFGLKIISEYGATESGIIAFECSEGNMHINMEGVIVEEIENEILVTNLQMKSFPVIRYKLGDYISLAPREFKCKCGRNHRVLKEVTGRVGANVYGKENIYPSLYFYYIFKNLLKTHQLKLNYQVIQNLMGVLEFRIEQELSSKELILLDKEIKKHFKEDMVYEVDISADFIKGNGKFKSFISNI